MLNLFRQREKFVRWVLGGLLVLICIGMTMTLIPGFLSGPGFGTGSDTIAIVEGHKISATQLDQALQQEEQQEQIPASFLPYVGNQILQSLILRQAELNMARRLGLKVNSAEIVHALRQDPNIFPQGKFIGAQQYRSLVAQAYQMTVPQYEAHLGRGLLAYKFYTLITDGVRVSPAAVRAEFEQEYAKARIGYVALDPRQIAKTLPPPQPAALQAYYAAHRDAFRSPERRQIEFVLANPAQLSGQIQVSSAQIARAYEQNLSQYQFPERAKVEHILIKTTGLTPAQTKQAKQKALGILAQLRKGAHFSVLAKKYSQDPGSAANGGKLGWIEPGQTVPAFQQAAFSLPIGQLSPLVKTVYGYHIIKVLARQPAHTESLAQATPAIEQSLQQQASERAARNAIQRVQTLAASEPLSQAARQLHLTFIKTPLISQTDPVEYVGVNPEFTHAVFSAPVNSLTPPMRLPAGYIVAKVKQIQAPGTMPFSTVANRVARDLRRQQAQALAVSRAQKIAQMARQKSLAAAVARWHLKVVTSHLLGRDDELAGIGPVSGFFGQILSLKPGQVAGPVSLSRTQIVYTLLQLKPPPSGAFARYRSQVQTTLLNRKRQLVFTAFTDALQARLQKSGQVKINQSRLDSLVGGAGS